MDHTPTALTEGQDLRERAQLVQLITQAQAALGDDYRPNKGIGPVLCLFACVVLMALLLGWLLVH